MSLSPLTRELLDGMLVAGVAGAAIFWAAHLLVGLEPSLSDLPPLRGNASPAPPPIPAPNTARPAVHLPDGDVALAQGWRYYASVTVSGLASLLANASAVKDQAVRQGFPDATVAKALPPGWPPLAKGDYYVSGTYQGAPAQVARSQAGGSVRIVDAWRA